MGTLLQTIAGWFTIGGNTQINGDLQVSGSISSGVSGGLKVTKLWRWNTLSNNPCYSSPLYIPDFACPAIGFSAGPVVVVMAYDWNVYVITLETQGSFAAGTAILTKTVGGPNYGRPQALKETSGPYSGLYSIYAASHDGYVWALYNDFSLKWRVPNLYARNGVAVAGWAATGVGADEVSGTVSSATTTSLTDSGQSWAPNTFLQQFAARNCTLSYTGSDNNPYTVKIASAGGTLGSPAPTVLSFATTVAVAPKAGTTYSIAPADATATLYQHAGTLSVESGVPYLYVTGFDGQCVKIDAATGAIFWRFNMTAETEAWPWIGTLSPGGTPTLCCVVHGGDDITYCLNAATGALIWEYNPGSYGPAGAPLVLDIDADGILEVVVNGGAVQKLSILNGNTGALKHISGNLLSTLGSMPQAVPTGTPNVYDIFTDGDAGIMALLDNTAETLWTHGTDGGSGNGTNDYLVSSAVLGQVTYDGTNKIIIGDVSGKLYVWSGDAAGAPAGAFYTKGTVEGNPITPVDWVGDGKLRTVVPSNDGYLTAYQFG